MHIFIQYEFYLTLYEIDTFIGEKPPFSPSFIWLYIRWIPYKMDTSIQWEFYLTLYKVDTFIRRTPLFSPTVIWLSIRWTPLSDGHLLLILVLFDSRWDGHLYKRDTFIQWEFYLTLYKVDTFIRRTPPFNPSFIWLSIRWTPLSDWHLHSVRVLFDPRWDGHLYKRDTYIQWEF